jgi:hypothetical protein
MQNQRRISPIRLFHNLWVMEQRRSPENDGNFVHADFAVELTSQ